MMMCQLNYSTPTPQAGSRMLTAKYASFVVLSLLLLCADTIVGCAAMSFVPHALTLFLFLQLLLPFVSVSNAEM